MVEIFSTESCFRCKFLKKWLESEGIPFNETMISDLPIERVEYFRREGFTTAPIIKIGSQLSSGVDIAFIERNL